MAVFKCKICGGTLEINVGETVATCEYCGTKQTLPKLDDEKKANLFDRANHFRRNNDFDKAMGIYEQILNEDTEDAESYWSIVLCRYGIEYVEDPSSRKRVPTVNRAQFTSVFDDEDYKSAIKYADSYQKNIYEAEAAVINEIQKGILAISQKEEPFDVFICYKETDNNGRRTQDSVLATELYHELTKEGFKVFFSRITLEDKLGVAYEPYIFAALHSAKVMVALGTKPEHFNAVWVKNEWSRYLSLIKNGANKILIPAYRDMDPYDLPEEFSHLQAQDMSKLGFMQDLVRGIKKLVSADSSSGVKETVVVQSASSGNASALVKRGFLALEDGEWERADEFFEQALNQNAEDAQAYLGKLMAEIKVSKQDNLIECKEPFENMSNYQKAVRFADDNLKKTLKSYVLSISERNKLEQTRTTYASAMQKMKTATTEERFLAAATEFESISDYKNSKELAEECRQKAENAWKEEILRNANSLLDDSHRWIGKETDLASYVEAVEQLEKISGYKDADEKAIMCQRRVDEITVKLKEEKLQQEREREEERLEQERLSELKRIEAEKKAEKLKKYKRIIAIITPVVCVVIILVILLNAIILPSMRYNNAVKHMESRDYKGAIENFTLLGDYKDSKEKLLEAYYRQGKELLIGEDYEGAIKAFISADNYKDAKEQLSVIYYGQGEAFFASGDYKKSYESFKAAGGYKDSKERIKEFIVLYDKLIETYSNGGKRTYDYSYDDKGNVLKKVETDSDGKKHNYEYSYDKKDNVIKEMVIFSDGSNRSYEYSYDDYGNLIKKVHTSDDGKTYTYEYSYDNKGNIIKETLTTFYGSRQTAENSYDDCGNLFKRVIIDDSNKTHTYTYENIYDDYGNLIKKVEVQDGGNTYTTEYGYDNYGNLIKEVGSTYITEYAYEGIKVLYRPGKDNKTNIEGDM